MSAVIKDTKSFVSKYLSEEMNLLKSKGFSSACRLTNDNYDTEVGFFKQDESLNYYFISINKNSTNNNFKIKKIKNDFFKKKASSFRFEDALLELVKFKITEVLKGSSNVRVKQKILKEEITFSVNLAANNYDYYYTNDNNEQTIIEILVFQVKDPFNEDLKILISEKEVEIASILDIKKYLNGLIFPKDRTIKVNSNVKVVKKNSFKLPYGTNLQVERLAKSGSTTYAYLKSKDLDKQILLPVSKIKII